MTRPLAAILALLVLAPALVGAQRRIAGFIEPMPTAKLKQLFPAA